MFELKPTHHYVGMWRAMLGDNYGDVLAMIWKDAKDGLWHVKLRFRYFKDEKFFESKDVRSWWAFQSKTGDDAASEKMKAAMNTVFKMAIKDGHDIHDIQFIPLDCDGTGVANILMNPERPGFQWASMTEEQAAEYQRTLKLPEGVIPRGDGA